MLSLLPFTSANMKEWQKQNQPTYPGSVFELRCYLKNFSSDDTVSVKAEREIIYDQAMTSVVKKTSRFATKALYSIKYQIPQVQYATLASVNGLQTKDKPSRICYHPA